MESMDTATQIIARLKQDGYAEDLHMDELGLIQSPTAEFSPTEAVVDRIERVEGMSNPGDETMILALSGPAETRGVLVLPFGPDLSGPRADAVRALASARPV